MLKKMLFITNCHFQKDSLSGGERIIMEIYKRWIKKSAISVYSSNFGKYTWEKGGIVLNNDFILCSFFKDDPKTNSPYKNLFFSYITRALDLVRNRDFNTKIKNSDLIYSSADFWPDSLPAFYAKLKNKNLIWVAGFYLFAPSPWQKDSPYKTNLKRWLIGAMYWLTQLPIYYLVKNYADFVFVTSAPDVKKFITSKRDASKIIVIQGGVDITESEKYLKSKDIIPVEKRKYDACFVGRFHYQKGVLELIDIWKHVCQKKNNAKLAIIGIGPLERDVRDKIKKYGLEKNIDLLGFKDGQEKYEIFKQCKIMVHPATYDSGGMAAAEGMAWGLPGVSFDLEALKTYYPKGMVKTEQGNIEQFSENILKLLNEENYYNKISSNAHNLIIETWNWNKRSDLIYNKVFNHE